MVVCGSAFKNAFNALLHEIKHCFPLKEGIFKHYTEINLSSDVGNGKEREKR